MYSKRKKTVKVKLPHPYKAFVIVCFQCEAVKTYYNPESPIKLEQINPLAKEDGWMVTPRGYYCLACINQDAEDMVDAILERRFIPSDN